MEQTNPLLGQMKIDITGLGMVFFSPVETVGIARGSDYFSANYQSAEEVQRHIQKGSIVGFGTGSPGTYLLNFFDGEPAGSVVAASEYKLMLGLVCRGGEVHFRDLYDLMDWNPETPEDQILKLKDGIYEVTLCSSSPQSGVLGDDQTIDFFLKAVLVFPKLSRQGVPTLVNDE
jgi:hypothetical protein